MGLKYVAAANLAVAAEACVAAETEASRCILSSKLGAHKRRFRFRFEPVGMYTGGTTP